MGVWVTTAQSASLLVVSDICVLGWKPRTACTSNNILIIVRCGLSQRAARSRIQLWLIQTV